MLRTENPSANLQLSFGRRSGVAAEPLAQAFAILRDGSPAAGASLDVQTVDGTDLRLEWIEGE
jgi:Zn finger protein HypA/HybF involved in hydrogenase expression